MSITLSTLKKLYCEVNRDQMIRAMYDSRRLIERFAQDDSRKNGDDSHTDGDDSCKRDFFFCNVFVEVFVN